MLHLPEATVESHAGLTPQRFHQPHTLRKTRHPGRRLDAKRLVSVSPPKSHADDESSSAELVDTGQAFGEGHRAAQDSQKDRAAKLDALGARSSKRQQLERVELGHPAQKTLLRPQAVEAQRLGASDIAADAVGIEAPSSLGLGHAHTETKRRTHQPSVSIHLEWRVIVLGADALDIGKPVALVQAGRSLTGSARLHACRL